MRRKASRELEVKPGECNILCCKKNFKEERSNYEMLLNQVKCGLRIDQWTKKKEICFCR